MLDFPGWDTGNLRSTFVESLEVLSSGYRVVPRSLSRLSEAIEREIAVVYSLRCNHDGVVCPVTPARLTRNVLTHSSSPFIGKDDALLRVVLLNWNVNNGH